MNERKKVAPYNIPYRVVIANAFSINMLRGDEAELGFTQIDTDEARQFIVNWAEHAPIISVVGHADMATVLTKELGYGVECNRTTYQMRPYDLILVAQYSGPRLEEGATVLPDNAEICYWVVSYLAYRRD